MRFMDGMTAAQKIREADPEVILIFLTSMAGYAVKGYEVDALDYILKPVSYEIFSMVMTLEDDMCTLKTQPRKLLPVLGESGGTGFEGHEFFEASSIGKIRGRYYLVYSSVALHELCYPVSDHPDRDFRYGGVIVSNCDLFPGKAGTPLNCYGNNHGGLECIDGIYYIFYHRQTNRTMFSRQGCAEEVEILEDGSIPQTELTSCGLNGGAVNGRRYLFRSHLLQSLRQDDPCDLVSLHVPFPSLSYPGRTRLVPGGCGPAAHAVHSQRKRRHGSGI